MQGVIYVVEAGSGGSGGAVAVVERVGPSNLRATSHIPLPKKNNFPAGAEVR